MVAREATSSRRGSIWSTFGEDTAGGGIAHLTEEEKAEEARKAFANSFRTIWESGIDNISCDLWHSLLAGWKSGEIIGAIHLPLRPLILGFVESDNSPLNNIPGLFSIDHLGLSRIEHARAIVLTDELHARLQALAVATLALPGSIQS